MYASPRAHFHKRRREECSEIISFRWPILARGCTNRMITIIGIHTPLILQVGSGKCAGRYWRPPFISTCSSSSWIFSSRRGIVWSKAWRTKVAPLSKTSCSSAACTHWTWYAVNRETRYSVASNRCSVWMKVICYAMSSLKRRRMQLVLRKCALCIVSLNHYTYA